MQTVHVLAIITTKPGDRKNVLDFVQGIEGTVRAERGCIEYQATIDHPDGLGFQTKLGEDTFVVIEKWESMDALKDHAASPHMAKYANQTRDLVTARTVHILTD